MKDIKRLPDAELEVMQAVWSLEPPVTAAAVQQRVSHAWKATSGLTFLSRLCDQGFLRVGEKSGGEPVGRGRAHRTGHRGPARLSGRARTVGLEG